MLRLFFIPFLTLLLNAKETTREQIIMATYVTITTDETHSDAISKGFEIMRGVERSLSSYNQNATIAILNSKSYVKLDDYAYEAFLLSKEYYEKSDGYFDITVGSITKELYHFNEDSQRIPTKKELNAAKINFKGLTFNRYEARVEEGIKVDLGGMGKGFGVDKVAEYFRQKEIKDATISASGDIRCLGSCIINIQDPFSQDNFLLSFKTITEDIGISTSGNYNRFVKDTTKNHLINPKTKKPQLHFASITLVGDMPNSHLDAYATAASVMPIQKAYKFLDSIGVGYIVLQSDRELVVSKNISKFIKLFKHDASKNQPQYNE
ncbi:MAG: FAD:protein transferase [Campylobacterota bacterium]|nr:FAD:protein transferase [Campylobacterota bacterium]